jgi:hypothetical protein
MHTPVRHLEQLNAIITRQYDYIYVRAQILATKK